MVPKRNRNLYECDCATDECECAARSVRSAVRVLRVTGFLRGQNADSKWNAAYQWSVLGLTTLYLLQEIVHAYQVRFSMAALAGVLFLLLCHVTSIAKQVTLLQRADCLDRLFNMFLQEEFHLGGRTGAQIRRTVGANATRLGGCYAGTAVLTCSLWLVLAAHDRVMHDLHEFPFWTPFDTHHPVVFCLVLVYSFYVTTLVGVANTTMDALVAAVLWQAQAQFSILRSQLEQLGVRAKRVAAGDPAELEREEIREFLKCVGHFDRIVEMTDLLMDIFGWATLVQFAIGGWILCMAAYQMLVTPLNSLQVVSMMLFISCILTELLLYCYFGSQVAEESAMVSVSMFACGWERGARGLARLVLLAGERWRRVTAPRALRWLPLSLQTYLKILKSSYTFYAVLRQTKD